MMNRLLAAALLTGRTIATVLELSDENTNGSVIVETTSTSAALMDGPKIASTANDTTYDWWYFDAVSASTNESIALVFYNSGEDGFVNPWWAEALSVSITGTFANGTLYNLVAGSSSGAEITYDADGVSVNYTGAGISFTGSSLTSGEVTYSITLDSAETGVSGTVSFTSLAPAHYSCTTEGGSSEQVLPHVFWSNAVPDADAIVDVTFADGTAMQFEDGVGYHDKNWGDEPFADVVGSWYWGHAHLGDFSLVWFDILGLDGTEYFSGYVAENGNILLTSCAQDAVTVRPWGANDTYPPTVSSGLMQGLEVTFNLDNGTTLSANVTRGTIVMDYEDSVYIRALGSVTGGIDGGESYEGRGIFEQFALTA